MKQLIIILSVLVSSFCSIAQDKHKCEGKTKAGNQCQHITAAKYCKAHDPASPRCGAPTKSGGQCKRTVKTAGDKCFQHKQQHACIWPLCPYKGICSNHSSHAVTAYTGEVGTDAYKIDMLHIQHPLLDTDQLDSLLTSK